MKEFELTVTYDLSLDKHCDNTKKYQTKKVKKSLLKKDTEGATPASAGISSS